MKNAQLLLRALALIPRRRRRRWIVLGAMAVVLGLMEAGGAVLLYSLIRTGMDRQGASVLHSLVGAAVPNASHQSVMRLALGVAVLFFVGRGALQTTQLFLQNRAAHGAAVELATDLVSGYLRLPYERHLRLNSAERIRTAYESVSEVAVFVLIPASNIVSEVLVVASLAVVLLLVAPGVTLGALVGLSLVGACLLKVVQPRMHAFGEQAQASHHASIQALQQALTGIREIQVLGVEDYFVRVFSASRAQLARAQALRAGFIEVPRIAIESSLAAGMVVVLGISVFGGSDQTSFGLLGLLGYAAIRLLPSMNRLIAHFNNLRYGAAAVGIVEKDAADNARNAVARGPRVGTVTVGSALTFDHLAFRYAGSDRDALRDVVLTVHRGESVGIVGPTGSGKTTLLDVATGLLRPTVGRLLNDGIDVLADPPSWWPYVSLVPQMLFLADDTLRRNIALGISDDDIDDDQVVRAIEISQLGDVVAELPAGLDTRVGERGVRLSGGQRQRVAIARAMYADRPLLFFDEGTSALDRKTEAAVMSALELARGEKTILMVAHRISTVRVCDRIVLLDEGAIAAVGTFDQLFARNALFRELSQ